MEPATVKGQTLRDTITCPACRRRVRFVAVPVKAKGAVYASLRAVDARGPYGPGDAMPDCHSCRAPWPHWTWEELRDAVAADHS
jgi:hypothetical protein